MKTICFVTIDPIEQRRRFVQSVRTAQEAGFAVQVVSIAAESEQRWAFPLTRLNAIFNRGPFKFLIFNFRLAQWLLSHKCHTIYARGLWVLPAVWLVRLFKEQRVIYEAHEFFAGHELLLRRPLRRGLWLTVERLAIPKISHLLTVSEPLAELYRQRYPQLKRVSVVRNLPLRTSFPNGKSPSGKTDAQRFTMVFHGYFHKGRALRQIVQAMSRIKTNNIQLMLVGGGPLEAELRHMVEELHLGNRVEFRPFIPHDQLLPFLSNADLGLVLIQPDSPNRTYSLPNKFFELIGAGVPVLASTIPTLTSYVQKYDIGRCVNPDDPAEIAAAIEEIAQNKNQLSQWKAHCQTAAAELNWEQEAEILKEILRA